MTCETKTFIEIINSLIQSIALIIGGIWVYFKFIRTRENHPKIQFDLDVRVIGRQKQRILVELIAIITNKGMVRHWVNDFICDVLILQKDDSITNGDHTLNYQVKFKKSNPVKEITNSKEKYLNRIVWVPEDWYNSFVDPGVEQKYTYITSIPEDSSFISLFSRFITKNDYFHTAQRTFNIRKLEENI